MKLPSRKHSNLILPDLENIRIDTDKMMLYVKEGIRRLLVELKAKEAPLGKPPEPKVKPADYKPLNKTGYLIDTIDVQIKGTMIEVTIPEYFQYVNKEFYNSLIPYNMIVKRCYASVRKYLHDTGLIKKGTRI